MLSSFSVFDPKRQSPEDVDIEVLAGHYFDGNDSDAEEFRAEWKKLKYDILSLERTHPKRHSGWQEKYT